MKLNFFKKQEIKKEDNKIIINNKRKEINKLNSFINKIKSFNMSINSNSTADWNPSLLHQNQYLKENFKVLIARSRDLYNNSPIAKRYITLCQQNIVGANGFKLQIKNLDLDISTAIEKAWEKFIEKENFEISKKLNFVDALNVIVKSHKIDGEILFLETLDKDKNYKIQIIDTQRIDSNYYDQLQNGNIVIAGVEVNKNNELEAVYLNDYNTQTNIYNTSNRKRLSKENLNFLYTNTNPEQVRGIPVLATVGTYIKQLEQYNEQTLKAAKMGASMNIYLQATENNVNTSEFADGQEDDEDEALYLNMGDTEIMSMPKGFEVKGFQGQYPSEVYKTFTKKIIQLIASGLNVSPLSLSQDTEDVNYSTSRFVNIEDRENWKKEQKFYIDNICNKIFKNWLKFSLLNGKIKVKNKSLSINDYDLIIENFKFFGRSWDWMDPKNAADSHVVLLENNLTTKTDILAENGKDYEEILINIAKEKELEKKYNINIDVNNKNE